MYECKNEKTKVKNYFVNKQKVSNKPFSKINLAVFVSGNGSNFENITKYFLTHPKINVSHLFVNKPDAYALQRAKTLNIPTCIFSKKMFQSLQILELLTCDYIILAGFLWLIPQHIISAFPKKIINIHPSLLPKYGGRGMYGNHVHQAVIASGEKKSGITIHLINQEYDKGECLFQKKCIIEKGETVESLSNKIHQLEYQYFPQVIEKYILFHCA